MGKRAIACAVALAAAPASAFVPSASSSSSSFSHVAHKQVAVQQRCAFTGCSAVARQSAPSLPQNAVRRAALSMAATPLPLKIGKATRLGACFSHTYCHAPDCLRPCDLPLAYCTAGLFGGGTVGGGVYEICEADNKAFLDSIGADISISKICVRDASKVSDCIRVLNYATACFGI
jgi:hypothetical protein